MSLQFKDAKTAPEIIIVTPIDCSAESRWPIKINAMSIVNTAHRFMIAATIDILPTSKPFMKNKYPAE